MGLIRVLLIFVLIYLFFKLTIKYVLPYWLKRYVEKRMHDFNSDFDKDIEEAKKKDGKIKIIRSPKKQGKDTTTNGDYVDFEEVKD